MAASDVLVIVSALGVKMDKHPYILTAADIAYINHLKWKAAGCPRPPRYDSHVMAWLRHQGLCTNCRSNPCTPNCAAYKPCKLKTNWTPEAAADLRKMGEAW